MPMEIGTLGVTVTKIALADRHAALVRVGLGDDKRLSSCDADTIVWGAMECADKMAEGEVDSEKLLESVSVSGLPDFASTQRTQRQQQCQTRDQKFSFDPPFNYPHREATIYSSQIIGSWIRQW
jgi:hypothetical protein